MMPRGSAQPQCLKVLSRPIAGISVPGEMGMTCGEARHQPISTNFGYD